MLKVEGIYDVYIDGVHVGRHKNLVPTEGLNYFLSTGFNLATPETGFYLALFSGAVNPAANWTAANFASNASEIVSTTEGYSNTTRPAWTPGTVSSGTVNNSANRAVFNIVCSSTLNISGAALLTSNVRGGTSGKLLSATRFGTVYTVNNGSSFELAYEIQLSDV